MELIDFSQPPTLTDDGLTLRKHRLEDVDAVYERCRDAASIAWTTIPREYTRDMAEEYVKGLLAGDGPTWSWALEADGTYAGTLDLRFSGVDNAEELELARADAERFGGVRPLPTGEVGFVTHPAFRGRGLMGRAVRLGLGEAFRRGLIERAVWKAKAGNVGSLKAARAAGFPPHIEAPAILSERGINNDGWVSVLTREQWETAQSEAG
ncbi:GNAT family N-acetyltransferase [Falsarthrobacter nasiphocae]|uniref:RimJ/RimL family protein N-acetyltransferase n=1 Tax=Falsarthrobacter nasiphocae TaxID=189863 RepID=A0AAE3YFV2_9MICC|nr:GNAT family N-acetyltransferase [Falsarthrobacter nasiphocae]MDR6891977.1 RimJ/RimL family protein N-acetyltransferase [Falsarthrobacter nasiphocae]